MSSDNAYPGGELENLVQNQREDTSKWQNVQNHSPNPNLNPNSLEADDDMPSVERTMEAEVTAKVFVDNLEEIEGGKVLLASGDFQVIGEVIADAEQGFAVAWRTGRTSIEKKANYDLVVIEDPEEEEEYEDDSE